jgi:hypothetical protein
MKDVILLGIGFVSGVLVTGAFGAKVKVSIFKTLDKTVAKIEGK